MQDEEMLKSGKFCALAAKVFACLTDGPIYEYIMVHTTRGNITITKKSKQKNKIFTLWFIQHIRKHNNPKYKIQNRTNKQEQQYFNIVDKLIPFMNVTIQNKNKTRFEKIISDDGPIYEHIMTRKHQGYNNPKKYKIPNPRCFIR